mmetsp:Transcript_13140/g.20233  ORF Transcript_13140/g.20233 Transcript_13140/m.20233 type:complete len:288 (+) Transcript_13140:90-953(+)
MAANPEPGTASWDGNFEVICDWKVISTVGEGCDSKVVKAIHQNNGTTAAIKLINIRELARKENKSLAHIRERVTREARILHGLDHPNIVKLYDYFEHDGKIAIVMEFVERGELLSYIGPEGAPENEVRDVFLQILEALNYCHQHQVVHRDLKLENLLVDKNYNIKILDFGFSNFISSESFRMKTLCGTLMYLAPEIFLGKQYNGPPVDVWALGVILYAMLTGRFPFADTPQLPRDVVNGNYVIPHKVSKDARKLLRGMLCLKPEKRLTIPEILEGSWMKSAKKAKKK